MNFILLLLQNITYSPENNLVHPYLQLSGIRIWLYLLTRTIESNAGFIPEAAAEQAMERLRTEEERKKKSKFSGK